MTQKPKAWSCKNCGAPVTTEICPYCGAMTGLDTISASMEYPVIECKEAHIGFWNVAFPAIFALAFGSFGVSFPTIMYLSGELEPIVFLALLPFAIVGVVSAFITIRTIWFTASVHLFGKELEGTVYGYTDDNVTYNGQPGQVCKLLINTPHGPRFIMYQLSETIHPYRVNSKVTLKVYKDRFAIVHKHKYEAWE